MCTESTCDGIEARQSVVFCEVRESALHIPLSCDSEREREGSSPLSFVQNFSECLFLPSNGLSLCFLRNILPLLSSYSLCHDFLSNLIELISFSSFFSPYLTSAVSRGMADLYSCVVGNRREEGCTRFLVIFTSVIYFISSDSTHPL